MDDMDKIIKENLSLVELSQTLMRDLLLAEVQLDNANKQLAILEKFQMEREGTLVVN